MFSLFINKLKNGKKNICGVVIAEKRKEMGISQRELADRLQLTGMDVDKNAIQRIESGQRFVTDIELVFLSKALELSVETLLQLESNTCFPQEKGVYNGPNRI